MEQIRVEYVKGGINKSETFDSIECAEKWADENELNYDPIADEEGQYRLTS